MFKLNSGTNTSDLAGRVVAITGAGSGIGRELALLCAQRGADLALCDINDTAVADTAQTARGFGHDVITRRVDVSDPEQMTAFADATLGHFGGVDLLVNNAGVGPIGGFLDTSRKDWDWLVSINVMGVVHGCEAFLPAMIESGRGGHVVNLSSAAGLLANPALSAYSATKFAVLGLSEALRIELEPHRIGVTAICPGVINTAITKASPIRGAGDTEGRRQRLTVTYQRRGYTPARAARNILRAVERNKAVAPVAAEAHVMYVLSRIMPPLARWVSAQMAKAAK
ncbi:SDR family NAD(P)-dependent oxidoreductase [Mycobacterium ulcerans]|uniref:SDR family NAD(P)-dependent oxidoreductase n=1 Tax=Mycobacterium ulcerans TaxID=1809 RepID=UPI0012DC3C31|nr:SDR family NAD(P)-dependent oxidoreductase [Mycobacterium ulcerans]MEB3969538.1 SDR family NAD(P)-dependent oxidoreductase [Mycobacterium ulcerans]MEB3977841.1 SDR family NAD(P)-dependent oxidoreductase [Mycobacterium ulcerans]MEB4007079.1 SDR family NAD(P)-dependent oxidoreductase [Mycobacterium ulcerans]MEB4416717.1 SDR family NAD(P)-dependent oxidoreductase [Mycobacterium ulcerans]MEB4434867.1 SDR family NAD(P)-dependent oxidoreductase [Mycobacterium ulcerans]